MAGITGLDYTAVDVVVRALGVTLDEELLMWFQMLESWSLHKCQQQQM
jgi:hypothetical protein